MVKMRVLGWEVSVVVWYRFALLNYLLPDVTGTKHPGLMCPIVTLADCLEQYVRKYHATNGISKAWE
jgi:hypothetical protein